METKRYDRLILYSVPFLTALALIVILYAPMFFNWWGIWVEPGSFYAHAVFVPFFVGVMMWRNREKFATSRWKPTWLGLVLLLPAMALVAMGLRANVTVLMSLSFVLLMLGSSLLLLGSAKTRILLFPLLFILAMIPIFPDQLINVIAFPIQLKSTEIATAILNLIQLHATRIGTMIQMDSYKMAVEGQCSGFRTLISLLTFAAAFAYLVEGALWKRWTLFLITPVLSLFINGLRIAFIGIIGELVSTKAALTFHDYSGFIVLIIAFLVLFYTAQILRCDNFLGVPLYEPKKDGGEAKKAESAPVEEAPPGQEPAWWQVILAWRPTVSQMRRALPYVAAINLVLLTTLVANARLGQKNQPLPPIGTQQVPSTLTADGVTWQSKTNDRLYDRLTKFIQDQLNPTRVINRDYDGSDASQLQLFVTAGNARYTFHDPHNCSLGSAAQLRDVGVTDIPTKHGTLKVLECHFIPDVKSAPTLMMYFYVVESDILQRTEQVHKRLVMQTFLGDSGKPSYFFRVTQRFPGTDEEKRQQMLRFIAAMWNEVGPVMLGKTPAIEEPKPVPLDTES